MLWHWLRMAVIHWSRSSSEWHCTYRTAACTTCATEVRAGRGRPGTRQRKEPGSEAGRKPDRDRDVGRQATAKVNAPTAKKKAGASREADRMPGSARRGNRTWSVAGARELAI